MLCCLSRKYYRALETVAFAGDVAAVVFGLTMRFRDVGCQHVLGNRSLQSGETRCNYRVGLRNEVRLDQCRLGGDFGIDRTARINGGSPGRALAQAGGMEWLPRITSFGSYSALTLRSRA